MTIEDETRAEAACQLLARKIWGLREVEKLWGKTGNEQLSIFGSAQSCVVWVVFAPKKPLLKRLSAVLLGTRGCTGSPQVKSFSQEQKFHWIPAP